MKMGAREDNNTEDKGVNENKTYSKLKKIVLLWKQEILEIKMEKDEMEKATRRPVNEEGKN